METRIIPEPGTENGPCIAKCNHAGCREQRKAAKTKCRECREAIGYWRRHYVIGSYNEYNFVHVDCYETDREIFEKVYYISEAKYAIEWIVASWKAYLNVFIEDGREITIRPVQREGKRLRVTIASFAPPGVGYSEGKEFIKEFAWAALNHIAFTDPYKTEVVKIRDAHENLLRWLMELTPWLYNRNIGCWTFPRERIERDEND